MAGRGIASRAGSRSPTEYHLLTPENFRFARKVAQLVYNGVYEVYATNSYGHTLEETRKAVWPDDALHPGTPIKMKYRFWGGGFTDDMTARVVSDEGEIPLQEYKICNNHSVYLSFDACGAALGEYSIVLDSPTAGTLSLKAVRVLDPTTYFVCGDDYMFYLRLAKNAEAKTKVYQELPKQIRKDRIYQAEICWGNPSEDQEVNASLLRLSSKKSSIRLDAGYPWVDALELVAVSHYPPVDRLRVGEACCLPIEFMARSDFTLPPKPAPTKRRTGGGGISYGRGGSSKTITVASGGGIDWWGIQFARWKSYGVNDL